MEKLAIDGGEPIRKKGFHRWPVWDENELNALKEVLESGVWGIGGSKVPEFERKFAEYVGVEYGICV
ncbi:MAG: DegT/DnrJ/EryC1/StrS family aminotransferase, partial [Candidatus Poribacteria bacterium]